MEDKALENIRSSTLMPGDPSRIGPLVERKSPPLTDPMEMSQILCRQYKSVYNQPRVPVTKEYMEELIRQYQTSDPLDQVVVNRTVIKEVIRKIPNGSGPGPDGIPP